ncbi:MAG: GNAT family N-acetyltransferase [Actinomycetota bacterium]|nr:GNAT family N-acetyltransferase [Actinomycetota bacterium]
MPDSVEAADDEPRAPRRHPLGDLGDRVSGDVEADEIHPALDERHVVATIPTSDVQAQAAEETGLTCHANDVLHERDRRLTAVAPGVVRPIPDIRNCPVGWHDRWRPLLPSCRGPDHAKLCVHPCEHPRPAGAGLAVPTDVLSGRKHDSGKPDQSCDKNDEPPRSAHSVSPLEMATLVATRHARNDARHDVAMSADSSPTSVRQLQPVDLSWAEALIDRRLGGRLQARRGELIDVLDLPGLAAERRGEPIGLLTYRETEKEGCELVCIAAETEGQGAGTALVKALRDRVPAGTTIWVVTTNDNLDAFGFYQRRGFILRAVRPRAVERARRELKPSIPEIGANGIPIRDELELELTVRARSQQLS